MRPNAIAEECVKFPAVFREVVSLTLMKAPGDSCARALLFHPEPIDYDDVGVFHKKLKAVLGTGTFALEDMMVRRLARRLDVPVSRLGLDNIEKSAFTARQTLEKKEG